MADKGLSGDKFAMHFAQVRLVLLTMYLGLALPRARFWACGRALGS